MTLVLFFFLSLLHPLNHILDAYQLITLNLALFIFIAIRLRSKGEFRLSWMDWSWLGFGVLSLVSFGWAINPSLVWGGAFTWFTFFVWYVWIRNISDTPIFRSLFVKVCRALLILTFLGFIILYLLPINNGGLKIDLTWFPFPSILNLLGLNLEHSIFIDQWNKWILIFGQNYNYVSAFSVCLLPLGCYDFDLKNRKTLFLNIVFICFVGLIIITASSRGAFIAYLLVLTILATTVLTNRLLTKVVRFGLPLFIVFTTLIALNPSFIKSIPLLSEMGSTGESTRLHEIKTSIKIFAENPVVGIGGNNWYNGAYKSSVMDVQGYNAPLSFIRSNNHNTYFKWLSELGLLGLLSFLLPVIFLIINGFRQISRLDGFIIRALIASLSYLICLFFYSTAISNPTFFSGVQLIGFSSLAMLSKNIIGSTKTNRFYPFLLLILSFISTIWFLHHKKNATQYYKSIESLKNERVALVWDGKLSNEIWRDEEIYPENGDEILQQLEALYSKTWNTSTQWNNSIALQIAKLYELKTDYSNAQLYYELALEDFPTSENIKLYYAHFLWSKMGNDSKAKIFAEEIFNIQENHLSTRILLSHIALEEKNFERAKYYLKGVDNGQYAFYPELLNWKARMLENEKIDTKSIESIQAYTPKSKALKSSILDQLD